MIPFAFDLDPFIFDAGAGLVKIVELPADSNEFADRHFAAGLVIYCTAAGRYQPLFRGHQLPGPGFSQLFLRGQLRCRVISLQRGLCQLCCLLRRRCRFHAGSVCHLQGRLHRFRFRAALFRGHFHSLFLLRGRVLFHRRFIRRGFIRFLLFRSGRFRFRRRFRLFPGPALFRGQSRVSRTGQHAADRHHNTK